MQQNHFLAGQLREIDRLLEAVELREAPEAVLVAVEEAEDAAEDADERGGQRLRGAVEERGDREGHGALGRVEHLGEVLTALGAAFHTAIHVLRDRLQQ